MSDTIIKIENLWKEYRYGTVSHQYLFKDLQSWWARKRGKEDPNAKIASGKRTEVRGQQNKDIFRRDAESAEEEISQNSKKESTTEAQRTQSFTEKDRILLDLREIPLSMCNKT